MSLRWASAVFMTFFRTCGLWVGSMAFHLWRIATLQPYYIGIADTGFSNASFFAVFVLAAAARWYGFAAAGLEGTTSNILQSMGLLMLISLRRHQSDSLFCALMASSAIVDLLVCAAMLTGATDAPRGTFFQVLELGLYFNCIWTFKRAPVEVRRSGYKRYLP